MQKEYLLVDGYNIIFAWDSLRKLADDNLDFAREKLINIMCNYQGIKNYNIIIVFDAHLVKGNLGSVQKYGNLFVVYTKEAETADNYIEKTTSILKKDYTVRVATSDGLEQVIIMGNGAIRVSASELEEDVKTVNKSVSEKIEQRKPIKNNLLMDNLDEEAAQWLENLRRKK